MDFKERFGVCPPVVYTEKVEVKKALKERFWKCYKKFFKKHKPKLFKTRSKQFAAFFNKIEKKGSDIDYCNRVSLKHISKKIGYGVFAKEAIAPYSTLHFYTGVVVPTEKLKAEHDSSFSFLDFPDYCIDAMKRGNWTRFMNHSDMGSPTNNVVVWEYYTEDGPKIVFTAGSKGIKKGAQLLYSYGEEYWSDRKAAKLK